MSIRFAIRRLFCWLRGEPIPLRTIVVEEMLDDAKVGVVYLYRVSGDPWGLGFLCPCGCNELIELNLVAEVRPCWEIRTNWDTVPSLHPSVWRKVGCRSHFWIRDGRVKWVE